jgi:multidrug efflux pump subunit AcrA (membrane-fusion protein)
VKEQFQKLSISSSSKFFFGITCLFVIFFLWMAYSKVDVTTQATGTMIPESNSTTIDTMVDGQIEQVNFKQGDIVKQGDIILIINPGVGYEPYNVIANVKGRIQTLHYRNPGSVVKKGEPILTIVPEDQKLIVLGKLFVKDRGYVKVGQESKIKLANQDQLKFGPIDAKIISISPDAVQSQQGSYYEIELELAEQKFTAGNIEYILVPGIQVQIFRLTGERTVLSYVTTPFHNGIGKALQER